MRPVRHWYAWIQIFTDVAHLVVEGTICPISFVKDTLVGCFLPSPFHSLSKHFVGVRGHEKLSNVVSVCTESSP